MSAATLKSDKKIWILEDDREAILIYQEALGLRYSLMFLRSIEEFASALTSATEDKPTLLIADLRLPDGDFISFLNRRTDRLSFMLPFIVVSSCDDLDILRACFQEGASDYLVKPFMKNELIVKLERLLALSVHKEKPNRNNEELALRGSGIKRGNTPLIQLTSKELKIFSMLNSATKAVTRDMLQKEVWKGVSVTPKTLDVHIFNLRKKLDAIGMEVRFVAPDGYTLSDRVNSDELLDLI